MKASIFILCALIGLCFGAAPLFPSTYTYKYNSTVRVGVPSRTNQYAQFGLESKVKITVKNEGEADFQISDPKIYEHTGEIKNKGTSTPEGIVWQQISDNLQKSLISPFKMLISENQEVLQVDQSDPLHIKNIKKAIASVFRVPHFLSHAPRNTVNIRENRFSSADEQFEKSFRRPEELIQGRCLTSYTLTNASQSSPLWNMEQMRSSVMARDSAGRGSSNRMARSAPKFYQLYKSIDHDECTELVVTTKSNHGNFSRAGTGYLNGFMSRSSGAMYIMSGEPTETISSLVIETGHVEGYVTVNPVMADEQEKLVFTSNQTVQLLSKSKEVVAAPKNLVKETWMFKIASPNKQGPKPIEWIEFQGKDAYSTHVPENEWTGLELNSSTIQSIRKSIDDMVADIVRLYPNSAATANGDIIYLIDSLTSRMRSLDQDQLKQVLAKYINGDPNNVSPTQLISRSAVMDSLSIAGTPASVKVLLDSMQQNKFSRNEILKIWTTVADNTVSAVNFKSMMNYAKQIISNQDITQKSVVLLSVSSLIRRLCIMPNENATYQWPNVTYGAEQCPRRDIDEYATWLTTSLENESNNTMKPVMIQANSFLGHSSTVSKLLKVAKNQVSGYSDDLLRILAIVGLSKNYVTPQDYERVILSLLYAGESMTDSPRINKAAYAVVTTFPHNAEFWQRVAMMSRKQPNSQITGFLKSMVLGQAADKDFLHANMTAIARHALQQMFPDSSRYTSYTRSSSGRHEDDSETEEVWWSPENNYTNYAEEYMKPYFTQYKEALGGIDLEIREKYQLGACQTFSLSVLLADKNVRSRLVKRNDRVSEEFEQIISGHSEMLRDSRMYDNVCVSLEKNLGHLDNFAVSEGIRTGNYLGFKTLEALLKEASPKAVSESLSYTQPIELSVFMPSDNGFPIFTELVSHRLTKSNQSMEFTQGSAKSTKDLLTEESVKIQGSIDRYATERITTTIKSITALGNSFIQTTVNSDTREIIPDLAYSVHMDRSAASHNKLEIEVTPKVQAKTQLFGYSRELLISSRPMYTNVDILNEEKLIRIDAYEHTAIHKLPFEQTGLSVQVEIKGKTRESVRLPSLWNIASLYKSPMASSMARNQIGKISVVYDPQASETKSLKAVIVHAKIAPKSQASGAPRPVESLSADDTVQQRIEKLRSSEAPVDEMWSVQARMQGSNPSRQSKNFEFAYMSVKSQSQQSKYFQLNVMRGQMSSSPAKQVCLSGKLDIPSSTAAPGYKNVLESQVYIGEKCHQQSAVLSAKGDIKLREEPRALSSKVREIFPSSVEEMKLKFDVKSAAPRMNSFYETVIESIISKAARRSYCVPKQHSDETVLTLSRSTDTSFTHVTYEMAGVKCYAKDIILPMTLTPIVRSAMRKSVLSTRQTPMVAQCTIAPRYVKTLSGEQYEKVPIKCFSIASAAMMKQSQKFVVMVKEEQDSEKQSAKIVYPADSLVVELKHSGVWVNGDKVSQAQKEIKIHHEEVILNIQQNSASKTVTIPGKFSVKLAENGQVVKIEVTEAYKSKLEGLCGKFSGDRRTDLQDAARCSYQASEGKLYAASWIAASEMNSCAAARSSTITALLEKKRLHCSSQGL